MEGVTPSAITVARQCCSVPFRTPICPAPISFRSDPCRASPCSDLSRVNFVPFRAFPHSDLSRAKFVPFHSVQSIPSLRFDSRQFVPFRAFPCSDLSRVKFVPFHSVQSIPSIRFDSHQFVPFRAFPRSDLPRAKFVRSVPSSAFPRSDLTHANSSRSEPSPVPICPAPNSFRLLRYVCVSARSVPFPFVSSGSASRCVRLLISDTSTRAPSSQTNHHPNNHHPL